MKTHFLRLFFVLASLTTLCGIRADVLPDSLANDSTLLSLKHDGQSVGLVLSGGGAKGIAHIGVIKALEDNDIPIDYITGTSMGAIVGSLYAIGYSPDEMLNLLLSREFSYWSTGTVDPEYGYYIYKKQSSPAIFSIPLSSKTEKQTSSDIPASLISPLPMTFAFMTLYAPYTAQCNGDFNKLFVPFRCVASDMEGRHKVVMSKGRLSDAVRASMSFPGVFQPTMVDSTLLYDGGIYDNYPINVMRRYFSPAIMIGSNVSSMTINKTSVIDQMENLVMQKQSYYMPPEEGMTLRFDLDKYSLLDFQAAQKIYDIGYNKAMDMMDSIKGRVHSRISSASRHLARDIFKSRTPYLRFDSVEIKGGSPAQNRYLRYLFRKPAKSDTFGVEHARLAYYQAISSGKIKNLSPQAVYNDSTGLYTLKMDAAVKNNIALSIGGYITTAANNYLFASLDYSTLSFNSVNASFSAWVGQNYLAGELSGRLFLRTHTPSFLSLQIVASRRKFFENQYLFYEDRLPAFILDCNYYSKLGWAMAAGRKGRFDVGLGVAHIYQSFYDDNSSVSFYAGKDMVNYNLASAYAEYEYNSLDDINYPVNGSRHFAYLSAVKGHYRLDRADITKEDMRRVYPVWLQGHFRTENYLSFSSRFSLGLTGDVMVSTRKLNPSYTSTLVGAPAYKPTPASNNSFNPAFRANSFLAAGVIPIYKYNDNLSARLNINGFLPFRRIEQAQDSDRARHGRWFKNPVFFSELDIVYRFSSVALTGYINYSSSPEKLWNVGLSLGVFVLAPKFLK